MVAIRTTSLLFSSVALLASYVHAYGQIAQVVDAKNFCVFLPPTDSADRNIADAEWEAQAFCTGKAPLATNAGKLASGFIQSAHYVATDQYVQVTGQIDPIKAKLNTTDEGGQMDIKAPKGSSCAGWKYYVNLIEPAGNTYCMRCCNDPVNCNRGISEKGCAHIIQGDYSGPMKAGGGSSDSSAGSSSPSSSTTKKSSTTTKSSGAKTSKSTTTLTTASTTTSAPGTTTTPAADNGAAANSKPSTTTTTTEAGSANTTPEANAADASPSPVASPKNDAVTDSSSSAPTAAGSSSSSTANTQMLSQNEQVTGQSISGAEKFQPSMIALTITLIAMAMMN